MAQSTSGIRLSAGRLWVSSVVLTELRDRHFSRFYGFLKAGAWSVSAVRRRGEDGRLYEALDDTVCARSGRKFSVIGTHHDPMNRQNPKRWSCGPSFVRLAQAAGVSP
jgi:hypothetical protein